MQGDRPSSLFNTAIEQRYILFYKKLLIFFNLGINLSN